MAIRTCEYIVQATHRELYDLNDTDSLNAFHGWVGKRVSDSLIEKYGPPGLDVIPQDEIWEDDLGLVQDCDFLEQPDGSLLVTFSRESAPEWRSFTESDITRDPKIGISVDLNAVLARLLAAA